MIDLFLTGEAKIAFPQGSVAVSTTGTLHRATSRLIYYEIPNAGKSRIFTLLEICRQEILLALFEFNAANAPLTSHTYGAGRQAQFASRKTPYRDLRAVSEAVDAC